MCGVCVCERRDRDERESVCVWCVRGGARGGERERVCVGVCGVCGCVCVWCGVRERERERGECVVCV